MLSQLHNGGNNQFNPIKPLRQKDADLYLLFLAQTNTYFQPVNDPWFQAVVPVKTIVVSEQGSAMNGESVVFGAESVCIRYGMCAPVSALQSQQTRE